MLLLLLLVFLSVFVVIILLLVAHGTGASQRTKQVLANLDAALANGKVDSIDQMIDVRKMELLSAIP
jgi:hypothetical protein